MGEKFVIVKVSYGLAALTTALSAGRTFESSAEASRALGFPGYNCVEEFAEAAAEEGRKRFEVAGVTFEVSKN